MGAHWGQCKGRRKDAGLSTTQKRPAQRQHKEKHVLLPRSERVHFPLLFCPPFFSGWVLPLCSRVCTTHDVKELSPGEKEGCTTHQQPAPVSRSYGSANQQSASPCSPGILLECFVVPLPSTAALKTATSKTNFRRTSVVNPLCASSFVVSLLLDASKQSRSIKPCSTLARKAPLQIQSKKKKKRT